MTPDNDPNTDESFDPADLFQKIFSESVDPSDALEAEAIRADFSHPPFLPGISSVMDEAIVGWLTIPGNDETSLFEAIQDILEDLPEVAKRYTQQGVWNKILAVLLDHMVYNQGWTPEQCTRMISVGVTISRKVVREMKKQQSVKEETNEEEE